MMTDETNDQVKVLKEPLKRTHESIEQQQDSIIISSSSGDKSTDKKVESAAAAAPDNEEEKINFKVVYKTTTYPVSLNPSVKVSELKSIIKEKTGIHENMMKLLFKGTLKDENDLTSSKIKENCKVILMSSSVEEVAQVVTSKANPETFDSGSSSSVDQVESWSEQTQHKKILAKGKPDDAEPGLLSQRFTIPERGVEKLWNHQGVKTRLTFKRDESQLWIGTAERTQKIPYAQIRAVTSEQIKESPEYHIVALQLGPTSKSNYYLYYVPCQFVEAIKEAILGKWSFSAFT